MNLYSIISFLTAIIVFFWGTFVFSKDTKDLAIRLFLVFSILTSFEAVFEYLFINSHSLAESKYWLKFHILGWPLLYVVQFHFLIIYASFRIHKQKLFFTVLYTLTSLLLVYFSFFDIYSSITSTANGWIRVPFGIQHLPEGIFAFFMTSMTFAVTFISLKFRLKAIGGKAKLKANLILAGILIPTWIPFLKNAILPGIFDISILFPDSTFIFLGWSCLVIAILYFKMFNLTPKSAADKILETMNEALIMTNVSGGIVWANNRFYELFEIIDNENKAEKFELLRQMNIDAVTLIGDRYKKEELKNLVLPITTANNNQIYVGVSSAFLKNEFNEMGGIVIIMNDINELIIAQKQLKQQQEEMLKMAHQAGMSEVTTSVMHNIGNVLNSVNVSSEYINMILGNSKLPGLIKANDMLLQHNSNLGNFITNDPKGQLLPDYYFKLGKELTNEQEKLIAESQNLFNKIKIIKETIDIQQDYSMVRNLNETINLNTLIDEVISILEESFRKNEITIRKEYSSEKEIKIIAPVSKLINILMNVVKNAIESVKINTERERIITINIRKKDSALIEISISDNGIGISPEVMPDIFKFGFTTKQNGHGYGLHFCANVLKEMNGSITAKSKGLAQGAKFKIIIPEEQK